MNVRKYLVGILVLGLIVRVASMTILQTWIFPSERAYGYEEGEVAYALANGQGFSWPQTWRPVGPPGAMVKNDHPVPTTWKAPVNPMIIAAAFWLFGSYSASAAVALELFQILLSLLSCYVLFRLGRMLFNEWTGLAAAFIFALYPASIYFSVKKIEYGTLLTLLGLLLVHQALLVSKRPSIAGSLLLGALVGLGSLVNPVILAFFPFALLWLLWTAQSEWRTRLKAAVAVVGCCVAVMAPWLIRNYVVFDRFMFIRSNFAREFVISNLGKDAPVALATESATISGNEGRGSTAFNQKALSVVLQKPAEFLRNIAVRFRNFWTYLSDVKGRTRLVVGFTYFSVLAFALAGLWLARRQPQARLPIIYLLTMPIPFYLTWARMGRFRFPIEPFLILFASYAMTSLLSRLLQRNHPA